MMSTLVKAVPAVLFQCLAMAFRGLAGAAVKDVAFHDVGIGDLGQKCFDPLPWQDVRAVGFAGVQLDGDFSADVLIDHAVKPEQACRTEFFREVDVGFFSGGVDDVGESTRSQGSKGEDASFDEVTTGNTHGVSPKRFGVYRTKKDPSAFFKETE